MSSHKFGEKAAHVIVHVAREAPKVIEQVVKEIQERRDAEDKRILENLEGYRQTQREQIERANTIIPTPGGNAGNILRAKAESNLARADKLERKHKEGKG